MRRIITAVGIGLLATALTAGVAGAAPATPAQTGKKVYSAVTTNERHWYAIAGVRRTEGAAKQLMAKLEAKRFEGFQIRTREVRQGLHHVRRFEVERMFRDHRAAETEAKQLREAGFPGRVARQRG